MAEEDTSSRGHGNQGGGPLHTTATVDRAGFMSPADKTIVDDAARKSQANVFTQNQTISKTSGDSLFVINSIAGTFRYTAYTTGGAVRWAEGANNEAETGSNAGSNYFINRYTDAGAFLGTPMTINRATGLSTFERIAAPAIEMTGGTAGDTTITRYNVWGVPQIAVEGKSVALEQNDNLFEDNQYIWANGFDSLIFMRGLSGTYRGTVYEAGASPSNRFRWFVGVNKTAETGANTGSDFDFIRYDDTTTSAGPANLSIPIRMIRNTGEVRIDDLKVNLNLIVDGETQFNGNAYGANGGLYQIPRIFTSGTSYTVPAGVYAIWVECVGGGGAGGGTPATANTGGGGGASGAYSTVSYGVSPSDVCTFSIGAGGTGVSGGVGNTGGATTFTANAYTITANGGLGGNLGSTTPVYGGNGQSATNGYWNLTGDTGEPGLPNLGGRGGKPPILSGFAGTGGINNNGFTGALGAGGGGAQTTTATARAGGNGGSGFIRLWEFYGW